MEYNSVLIKLAREAIQAGDLAAFAGLLPQFGRCKVMEQEDLLNEILRPARMDFIELAEEASWKIDFRGVSMRLAAGHGRLDMVKRFFVAPHKELEWTLFLAAAGKTPGHLEIVEYLAPRLKEYRIRPALGVYATLKMLAQDAPRPGGEHASVSADIMRVLFRHCHAADVVKYTLEQVTCEPSVMLPHLNDFLACALGEDRFRRQQAMQKRPRQGDWVERLPQVCPALAATMASMELDRKVPQVSGTAPAHRRRL